jgi:hypothetical protein
MAKATAPGVVNARAIAVVGSGMDVLKRAGGAGIRAAGGGAV